MGEAPRDRYLRRTVDGILDGLIPSRSALLIEGARGVGKTATAMQRATTVFELDDPVTLAALSADPKALQRAEPPVLVDEWQRLPSIFDVVRRGVDSSDGPHGVLLTGSALSDAPAHSGAGRVIRLQMRPMSLEERGIVHPTVSLSALLDGSRPALEGSCELELADYVSAMAASGLPGVTRERPAARRELLSGYLRAVVDRDIPDAGRNLRRPDAVLRWLRAYGAASSSTASYTTILDAATPGEADKPVRAWVCDIRDLLERIFVLDPVPAWLPGRSPLAELGTKPKHQLCDPALVMSLLGIGEDELLRSDRDRRHGDLLGRLFESLVTLDLRVAASASAAQVRHLRQHRGGREVDLIVERGDGRIVAVEVKLSGAPQDGDLRHLRWLRSQIGDDLLDSVVVTAGRRAYRTEDGIGVIPAGMLGA